MSTLSTAVVLAVVVSAIMVWAIVTSGLPPARDEYKARHRREDVGISRLPYAVSKDLDAPTVGLTPIELLGAPPNYSRGNVWRATSF